MDRKYIKHIALCLAAVLLLPFALALPVSAEEQSVEDELTNTLPGAVNYEPYEVYDENTIALFHMDGNLENEVPGGAPLTIRKSVGGVEVTDAGFAHSAGMGYNGAYKIMRSGSTAYYLVAPFDNLSGVNNFTFEFRMCFLKDATNIDSTVSFYGGDTRISGTLMKLQFSKTAVEKYNTNGNVNIAEVPVAVWHDICIQVENGKVFYWMNGKKSSVTHTYSGIAIITSLWIPCMPVGLDADVYIDEIRVTRGSRYSGDYSSSTSPFEYSSTEHRLPEGGEDGTVAIQSDIPASALHVGKTLPRDAAQGDVALLVTGTDEEYRVQSIVQYQNGEWVSVDGSIYDNGGWNNAASYNVTGYVKAKPPPVVEPGGEVTEPSEPSTIATFLNVLSLVYSMFLYEMNVYGFVFSFWDVIMFGLLVGVVIKFVGYVFYED